MGLRRWIGRAVGALAVLATLAVCGVASENVALNLIVPRLLNLHPERLSVNYRAAWTWFPGRVDVVGLRIASRGAAEEWTISADRATGDIATSLLFHRVFQASHIRGRGVSVLHSARAPVQTTPTSAPWLVALDGIEAEVTEIGVGEYRITGTASVTADLRLVGPLVDLSATASLDRMRVDLGEIPVAQDLHGEASLLVDTLDRTTAVGSEVEAISGAARFGADVQDLRFLDFYLSAVPWLAIDGAGHVDAELEVERGQLRDGSAMSAAFPALVVEFAGTEITGGGRAWATVAPDGDGALESRLLVQFDDFSIAPDGGPGALVEGDGFRVEASSPEVALDGPFQSVTVVLDLPESRIPEVARYDVFLPDGVGLSLRAGRGTAWGHLTATNGDQRAVGDLYLRGDDWVVGYDSIAFTGDLAVHAVLDAQLGTGRYDLSGTTVDLFHVGLVDRDRPDPDDGARAWSASMAVGSGVVQVGAPIWLDTTLQLTSSDSVPFVTLFAAKRSLPRWLQGLVAVERVSGEARVRLGAGMMHVEPCVVRGGAFQLTLRFRRKGDVRDGDLFAQAGPLSLGVGMHPDGSALRLFGVRRWFVQDARSRDATTAPR